MLELGLTQIRPKEYLMTAGRELMLGFEQAWRLFRRLRKKQLEELGLTQIRPNGILMTVGRSSSPGEWADVIEGFIEYSFLYWFRR